MSEFEPHLGHTPDAAYEIFERMGEVKVRLKLRDWTGVTGLYAGTWLAMKDAERERERLAKASAERAEELALTERATVAAEKAALASEQAALAAKDSAKYTRAAAWASALAAVVALAAAVFAK
jgi:hypothetical protein